ncbi:MAG: hypothetical protein U0136_21495 [Bdellovibrionota bacterium]
MSFFRMICVMASLSGAQGRDECSPPDSTAMLRRWVDELGAGPRAQRDAAEERLASAGWRAESVLIAGTRHPDNQTRETSERLLRNLDWEVFSGTPDGEGRSALAALRSLSNHQGLDLWVDDATSRCLEKLGPTTPQPLCELLASCVKEGNLRLTAKQTFGNRPSVELALNPASVSRMPSGAKGFCYAQLIRIDPIRSGGSALQILLLIDPSKRFSPVGAISTSASVRMTDGTTVQLTSPDPLLPTEAEPNRSWIVVIRKLSPRLISAEQIRSLELTINASLLGSREWVQVPPEGRSVPGLHSIAQVRFEEPLGEKSAHIVFEVGGADIIDADPRATVLREPDGTSVRPSYGYVTRDAAGVGVHVVVPERRDVPASSLLIFRQERKVNVSLTLSQ